MRPPIKTAIFTMAAALTENAVATSAREKTETVTLPIPPLGILGERVRYTVIDAGTEDECMGVFAYPKPSPTAKLAMTACDRQKNHSSCNSRDAGKGNRLHARGLE